MTAENGVPIKKPWIVATSSKKLVNPLEQYQCAGPSSHLLRHPCARKETKRTEGYTDDMAEVVHAAYHEEAYNVRATFVLTAKSTEVAATGEHGPGDLAQKHPTPQDNPEMHDHFVAV